jgi:hypothetical protein
MCLVIGSHQPWALPPAMDAFTRWALTMNSAVHHERWVLATGHDKGHNDLLAGNIMREDATGTVLSLASSQPPLATNRLEALYGARFLTEICTRGYHWFPHLLA